MQALLNLIKRHKAGESVGVFSVCSAHPWVLDAAIRHAATAQTTVLIEATSNQVNQFGGYTGLRPADFRDRVWQMAANNGLPRENVWLGGDHQGPNAWQDRPAEAAMILAEQVIAEYVQAGFRKIHLDCSMSCADDPNPLGDDEVARRAARLCAIAEAAWRAGKRRSM